MRIKSWLAVIAAVLSVMPVFAAAQEQGAPAQSPTASTRAQAAPAVAPFDFSGSFYKTFSTSTTGNGTIQHPTDSYGGMVGGRYAPAPWKGLEIDYSYNHLDQSYKVDTAHCGLLCSTAPAVIPNNQSQVSVLYVASRRMGSLTPFAEGGFAFVIASATGNGYAINTVVRPGYVAGAGADFGGPRFGLRVQIRDTFYKAPNLTFAFLPTGRFMQTVEPMAGVYFRPW